MRSCKDCKHYKKKWWGKTPYRYRRYKNAKTIVNTDPVTGKVTSYVRAHRVLCEEERSTDFHHLDCGHNGQYWEAKG